jgi:hypothetical protein
MNTEGNPMTETKPKRRWFKFSIRDLLLMTAIVAVSVGWWLDHRALINRYRVPDGGPTLLVVYPVTTADRNVLMYVLKALFSREPDLRFALDDKSNILVVQAHPTQHSIIRGLVDKMEGHASTGSSPSMPIRPNGTAQPEPQKT